MRKSTRHTFAAALALGTALFGNASLGHAQEQAKPNILFIMGDDIGYMQPSIYHRGLMVGETYFEEPDTPACAPSHGECGTRRIHRDRGVDSDEPSVLCRSPGRELRAGQAGHFLVGPKSKISPDPRSPYPPTGDARYCPLGKLVNLFDVPSWTELTWLACPTAPGRPQKQKARAGTACEDRRRSQDGLRQPRWCRPPRP